MARPSRLLDVCESDKQALNQLLSSGVQQVRVGRGAHGLRSSGDGGVDGQSGAGFGAAISGRRAGGGAVRKGSAWKETTARCQHRAADCGDGLWRSARRASTLERAAHRRTCSQEEDGSQAGPGKLCACCWKATSSSRGGKKMWCLPQIDTTYLACMEDVLELYERPHNPQEP